MVTNETHYQKIWKVHSKNGENRVSKAGKSKLRLSVIKNKYFSNNVFSFFKGGDDFLTQLFKYDKQVVKTDIYNMRFHC